MTPAQLRAIGSLVLGLIVLQGGAAIGQETLLRVNVPAGQAGPRDDGTVAFTVPVALGTKQTMVEAEVVLVSRLEPCASRPAACHGGENFTAVDPGTGETIHGCGNDLDDDGDGATDIADRDCVGVQGWSLSVVTDDCFGIESATTRGTVGDLSSRPPGRRDAEGGTFEKTELVFRSVNGGRQGAVSAVVLSFTNPIFLGQRSDEPVLKLRGQMDASRLELGEMISCGIHILEASDPGLRGSGQAVRTLVNVGGENQAPGICNGIVNLQADETLLRVDIPQGVAGHKEDGAVPALIPVGRDVSQVEVEARVVLVSALQPCLASPGACDGSENFVSVDPGSGDRTHGCDDGSDNDADGATDAADPDCIGVQGWSLSVETEVCFNLFQATTNGTAGDLDTRPPGRRDAPGGTFEKTEIVNPALNGGRRGAVSAVVLSFANPVFLPQVGEADVLRLRGRVNVSSLDAGESLSCRVHIVEAPEPALRGSGQPVETLVNVGGVNLSPAVCDGIARVERQETVLRVDVPQGQAGEKVNGAVTYSVPVPARAPAVEVEARVVLHSSLEPCVSEPEACDGSENFVSSDPETGAAIYGCDDELDNDGDGAVDVADPDCIGVQAWSFSVATDPCFGLFQATTSGTVGDLASRPPGLRDVEGGNFEKTEVVNPVLNGGRQGAVSALVLSFTHPVILDQVGDSTVLRLLGRVDASSLDPGAAIDCSIRILEEGGFLQGSGLPVTTTVTAGSNISVPAACDAVLRLTGTTTAQTTYRLDVNDPRALAGSKSGGAVPWTVDLAAPEAEPVRVDVDVALVSNIEPCASVPAACDGSENFVDTDPVTGDPIYGCDDDTDNDKDGATDFDDPDCVGVQGWSLSIAADECFHLFSATTRGTVGDLDTRVPGRRDPNGSFEKTEVVSPLENGGQEGAVSAVVLSFTHPVILDQTGEEVVLRLAGRIDASSLTAAGMMTPPCGLRVIPGTEIGLAGSGEPVRTAITVGGGSLPPDICNLSVELRLSPLPAAPFRRGDPNDDGRIDIADPVWIVNEIFRLGPASPCQDAADANDDGMTDSSDAIFLIVYQFQGGTRPPPPFNGCGTDPTPDTVGCGSTTFCN